MKIDMIFHNLLYLTFLIFSSLEVEQATKTKKRWEVLTDVGKYLIFVDPKTVKLTKQGHIRAWTKWDPSLLYLGEIIKQKNETTFGKDDFDDYDHTIELVEFDCKSDKSRTIVLVDYGSSGQILKSVDNENAKWSRAIPESIGEAILQAMCEKFATMPKRQP